MAWILIDILFVIILFILLVIMEYEPQYESGK